MQPQDYIVMKIEGEYATIQNVDDLKEIFIALYLLPEGTDIGTRLHYENLEYTVV